MQQECVYDDIAHKQRMYKKYGTCNEAEVCRMLVQRWKAQQPNLEQLKARLQAINPMIQVEVVQR